jgi:hypothetical protein
LIQIKGPTDKSRNGASCRGLAARPVSSRLFIPPLRVGREIRLESFLRSGISRRGAATASRETMADVLTMALVVAAFAAAAAYAGLCDRLGRRPQMPDQDHR